MTNRYTIIVMWIACSSPAGCAADTSMHLEEAVSDADYLLGFERLERFAATEPHLDDPDECARRTLGTECMSFDARCLSFLREQPEVARRALPDNSQYWTRYRAVLEVSPISRTREDVERNLDLPGDDGHHTPAAQRAHGASERNQRSQGIRAARRHAEAAHRGGAIHATRVRGELQYATAVAEREDVELEDRDLDYLAKLYEHFSNQSEMDWDAYWRDGLQVPDALSSNPDRQLVPAMDDYLLNVRYLDAQLHVLRGLRELYGSSSPGLPPTPPPSGWRWDWQSSSSELCLEPESVHHALAHAQPICAEYLSL